MVNGLAQERSAYLRQHRSNPVNWLPWGEAALSEAKTFNKPILLSIGYSACHWCHVMARESFEDPETAALMNQGFVNIKVDREERPDLDALYLKLLQAMGRRPGWPLTMFLTPDGVPFWGGTYFPHEGQNGLPSFREVLEYVGDAYRSDPQGVAQKGRALIDVLMRRPPNGQRRATITDESAQTAAAEVLEQIDRKNGGLEGAPKFPYPAVFAFLWNQGLRSGRRDLCAAAGFTLERIAASGLHDHVGGGFFRYTVDAEWKIPHFEKMLYDNALLVSLYSELYRREAGALHRDLVRRTVEWLLGEMRVGDTAFASTRLLSARSCRGGVSPGRRGTRISSAIPGFQRGFRGRQSSQPVWRSIARAQSSVLPCALRSAACGPATAAASRARREDRRRLERSCNRRPCASRRGVR
jgi:uncharacterized protein YyaL (SSP411 family)